VRLATSNFAKMFVTWFPIVLVARLNREAIAAFDRPDAINPRTSRCRGVSSGNTGRSGRVPERKSKARLAPPGPKIASPAATEAIARITESGAAPLRT
jgi:hypothetical protein